ncbi:hypothetical protein LY11_00827 [Pedobacter cryoconitis]|uniref:Uncharacterized protein n=1 Tax=Pedobacter cryoconitis TaxID=188932 RepID=A0A327T3Y7_9SPHI|nr:hypothetical protein LY11_02931 [Pedobacter cryoconitis]RAJ35582.1 hypothetical protein LY11_00827 [Pedobacter cryoconitis]
MVWLCLSGGRDDTRLRTGFKHGKSMLFQLVVLTWTCHGLRVLLPWTYPNEYPDSTRTVPGQYPADIDLLLSYFEFIY